MQNQFSFSSYVPEAAASYCAALWKSHQFVFKITRARRTKLGDFRVSPGQPYVITVNENLNRYAFLITYLHEVAHLLVYHTWLQGNRRRRLQPHGSEWKQAFREVAQPVLNQSVFPDAVLLPFIEYLRNPTASTGANPVLTRALREADEQPANHHLLVDLPEGTGFRFLQKEFVRGMKRRTRIVCTETGTRRRVSIWAHVWVEKL